MEKQKMKTQYLSHLERKEMWTEREENEGLVNLWRFGKKREVCRQCCVRVTST